MTQKRKPIGYVLAYKIVAYGWLTQTIKKKSVKQETRIHQCNLRSLRQVIAKEYPGHLLCFMDTKNQGGTNV